MPNAKVVQLSPQLELIVLDKGSMMLVSGTRPVFHLNDREVKRLLTDGRAALLELKPNAQV